MRGRGIYEQCINVPQQLWLWLFHPSNRDLLLQQLAKVRMYEEYAAVSFTLDQCMEHDYW